MVEDLIRKRTYQSIVKINSDSALEIYLKETVKEIAVSYKKKISDFSIADVKRAVDSIYNLLRELNLDDVTLSDVMVLTKRAETAADIGNIISFAESVSGLVAGNFGWLIWHVSKNIAAPRVKRAAAVYIVGHVASILYGGDLSQIKIKSIAFDPIFETLDRDMLNVVSACLEIDDPRNKREEELITLISLKFKSEGKDQSLLRAWFPKAPANYVEVLIVLAKKMDLDIQGLESAEDIEAVICGAVFKMIWSTLSAEEKEALRSKMNENSGSTISGEYIVSAAGLGAIGLAQLSGFGVYTAAATSLGFLSSALGVSLPFSAYTGMSAAIGTALGPAGALVLIGPAVFEFLRAKPEKTLLSAVVSIAAFRAKLIAEGKLIDSQISNESQNKARIFYFISGLALGAGAVASASYFYFLR